MPPPLLLADAPHLLYRAFFALPDSIKDGEGRPVNALLGSVNQLMWCVERYAPRTVVCCFGQESADYRTEAYPSYHAHRPPMPDGLADQWERAPALYEALGWLVMSHPALEADDLLHALAAAEAAAGGRALILTGDRDLFQCASDRITVLLQRARQEGPDEMGPAEVEARYGIPPSAVPDFIALRGDPADGLPGGRGVGGKGERRKARRRAAAPARQPRGPHRRRDPRAPGRAAGAARPGRRAARLQGHRDAARRGRGPTARRADRQGARRRRGAVEQNEPARRAAGGRGGVSSRPP